MGRHADLTPIGLHALLQLIDVGRPLIASGGIATAAAVRAALALGASAAQVGTAFLRAPEAGTSQAHRDALATDAPTALTRAFSGRLARGIRNRFMDEHPDAPLAYPEIHYVTAPVRAAARKAGDADLINLWAGEAHALAEELPRRGDRRARSARQQPRVDHELRAGQVARLVADEEATASATSDVSTHGTGSRLPADCSAISQRHLPSIAAARR